ncbi:MAG: PA domain-containing protein [Thermoleophilaceae bacterium]
MAVAVVAVLAVAASTSAGPSRSVGKLAGKVGTGAGASQLQRAAPLERDAARSGDRTRPIARNFKVLGHHDLGAEDENGDVWAHGDFAYVGTWADPCNGRGVKIVDVSDLRDPQFVGTLGARSGTSAEDMVVRRVATGSFTGDLLAVGIQSCSAEAPPPDEEFGAEFWDVSDPTAPEKLSEIGVARGGGGVHELDLFQRGDRVYALLATPFTEWFDPVPTGDFQILDVTNPRMPVHVAAWGAGAHNLSPGPFFGQGSFGARFAHSARASIDGTKAYISYWDLGVLTFDITDIANPVLLSRTRFPADADGDAHSVSEYQSFLLTNDEDFDPRSPARIRYAESGKGIANESPAAAALWLQPGHQLTAEVVRASNQGCDPGDYPADAAGKIVVVATPFPDFDSPPGPPALCSQAQQQESAAAAGAAAIVHDFIAFATSPQFFGEIAEVDVPVLYTDHATAWGIVTAGEATLRAKRPSWGFLRVFDKETGRQVASFDDAPNVHALPAPDGDWTVHNNEIAGERSYASWYSNGVIALDLRPLGRRRPGDPVSVGQFVPPGAPSRSEFVRSGVAEVWGVAVAEREHGTVLFLSDMNSGLWIVKPTGRAAP